MAGAGNRHVLMVSILLTETDTGLVKSVEASWRWPVMAKAAGREQATKEALGKHKTGATVP